MENDTSLLVFAGRIKNIVADHEAGSWLNGAAIFKLHDTYGMPLSMIRSECKNKGVHFDERGIRVELRLSYGWTEEKIDLELKG